MKKTILALSIFCISNAALADSYYFRNPINGMQLSNVVNGEDSESESTVDDEIVLEEGDDALCQDISSQYTIYKYDFVSGDVDAYFKEIALNSPDGIIHSQNGTEMHQIKSRNIDAEIMLGTLPNSMRNMVYDPAFNGDLGDFVFSLASVSSFEYCGDNMDNMIISYGAGGVEDAEDQTDFISYSYGTPYFYKDAAADLQCAVDVTSTVSQPNVRVMFSEDAGFSSNYYTKANSSGSATVKAIGVNIPLSAHLDNDNVQAIEAYNDNLANTPVTELRETYFDEDNYYAVLRDDEDNIVSNHAVVDGHTETVHTYEIGNYVDRVTAPDDYPDADRMDRYEIILVGDCTASPALGGGGDFGDFGGF